LPAGCARDPAAREARALERGKKLLAKHDPARALLEFRTASQLMPKNAEPYYQAGLAAAELHDYRAAFRYFSKAAQLNPKHTAARLKIAEIMTLSGDKEAVTEAEKRLSELLPEAAGEVKLQVEALDALASAEAQLGKVEDSARHLQQALEKSPAHLVSAVALAQMKLRQKDPKGAEETI
jgi:cytochrome c-type biogenesis protein CcmH/NrfG